MRSRLVMLGRASPRSTWLRNGCDSWVRAAKATRVSPCSCRSWRICRPRRASWLTSTAGPVTSPGAAVGCFDTSAPLRLMDRPARRPGVRRPSLAPPGDDVAVEMRRAAQRKHGVNKREPAGDFPETYRIYVGDVDGRTLKWGRWRRPGERGRGE